MQRARTGSSQQFTIKKKVSWFGFWFAGNVCVVNRKNIKKPFDTKAAAEKREEKHTCTNLIFQPSKAIDSDDDTPVLEGKQAQKIAITFLLPFFSLRCVFCCVSSSLLSIEEFFEKTLKMEILLLSLCVSFS